MPTSVTMPALGESVTEGTVTRWLKQEGERVETDEPLLEVSTDKVDTEIPSPAAGVLTKILVAEDETVEVGAELALIGGDGEGGAPTDTAAPQAPPAEQVQEEPPAPAQEEAQPEPATAAASDGAGGGGSAGGGGGEGTPVTMPALGESVTEGTVTRWLKAVGDEVNADEPLLEVSTDKVDTEIPAPVSGTLLEITVNEDETVDVGAQLAVIGAAGGGAAAAPAAPSQEAAPAAPAQEAAPAAPAQQEAVTTEPPSSPATVESDYSSPSPEAELAAAPQPQPGPAPAASPAPAPASAPAPAPAAAEGDGGAYVTPLVRRLAAERGVDLGSVSGSRVGGRIRKQDVIAAAERAAAPAPAPEAPAAAAQAPGRRRRLPRRTRRCAGGP